MYAKAAQHKNPKTNLAKNFYKAIESCKTDIPKRLLSVPLDLNTVHVAVFIDAKFTTNEDFSSHLGLFICLTDVTGTAAIIHYTSTKCKRTAKSVLVSELYVFVLGFDQEFVFTRVLKGILSRQARLKMYTDSKCLFDAITSPNTTTKTHLLIDFAMLRQ